MRNPTYENAHPCRHWIAATIVACVMALLFAVMSPLVAQVPDTTVTFAHRVPTTPAFRSGFVLFRTQLHAGGKFVAEASTRDSAITFVMLKPLVGDSLFLVARHYWLNTTARATLIEADTLVVRTPVIVVPPPDTVIVPPPPPPPPPGDTTGGNNQTGAPGARLASPIVVTLTPGTDVVFSPVTGGGRISTGILVGTYVADSTICANCRKIRAGADGRAGAAWHLGATVGTQTAQATWNGGSKAFTATAAIDTTTIPPPPPPSGGCAVQPPAGVMFQDDFDAGTRTNCSGYTWATPGNVTVSTAVARSGSFSLRFSYPARPDGCGDGTSEQRLTFGVKQREAWVEYYIYFPDGSSAAIGPKFTHRVPICAPADPNGVVSNNKFFAIWIDSYTSARVVGEYRTTTALAGDSYMYVIDGNETTSAARHGNSGDWNPAITDALRGRWVQVRIYVKGATSVAAKDGAYKLWVDGTLRVSHAAIAAANANGANQWSHLYLMGWANSGFAAQTFVYIDDFKIFGTNPGW